MKQPHESSTEHAKKFHRKQHLKKIMRHVDSSQIGALKQPQKGTTTTGTPICFPFAMVSCATSFAQPLEVCWAAGLVAFALNARPMLPPFLLPVL